MGTSPGRESVLKHFGIEESGEEILNDSVSWSLNPDYPLRLEKDRKNTRRRQGNYYRFEDCSDEGYEAVKGSEELEVESVFMNPESLDFKLSFQDGEEKRRYRIIHSDDERVLLLGEVGYQEREVAQLKYDKETGQLKGRRTSEQGWKNYQGGRETQRIELIDNALKQVQPSTQELYDFYYAGDIEKEMKNFDIGPEKYRSMLEDVRTNLALSDVEPENVFDTLSDSYDDLLKLDMGDKEAIFIDSDTLRLRQDEIDSVVENENIEKFNLPETILRDDVIVGLGIFGKKRFKKIFESKDGNGIFFTAQQIHNNTIHNIL
ncbi:MAG: hypothetical protein ABEK16_03965 [Candidatus Nanohalobium sp.]